MLGLWKKESRWLAILVAAAAMFPVSALAAPMISTIQNPSTVTLSPSAVALKDTATLSGFSSPTGTITFTLFQGGPLVDTETVTVSGNGSYTTPAGYTLPSSGTVTGTYEWLANYSGDKNNNPSGTALGDEPVVVNPASDTIKTLPSPQTVTPSGSSVTLRDGAFLDLGYHPTGTITFTLFLGGALLDTETVTVSGNGSYTTPTGYTLPSSGMVTGTYEWLANYSGDANNNPSGTALGDEPVVVGTPVPEPSCLVLLGTGLLAGIARKALFR